MMKRIAVMSVLILAFACASAFAEVKPCSELISEIEASFEEKGVKNYVLEAVPNDKVKDGKVIGSCDGGTKKVVYTRKQATAQPAQPAKPAQPAQPAQPAKPAQTPK